MNPIKPKSYLVSANSIKERADPLSRLPDEIYLTIFSYLSAHDLGRSCLVSKEWKKLASTSSLWNPIDLKKLFPSLGRVVN